MVHTMCVLRVAFGIVIFYFIGFVDSATDYRQERAKVTYMNPKYVYNVSIFTARETRRDPYLTNFTAYVLTPLGNNVSIILAVDLKKQGQLKLEYKICDTFKIKWLADFLKAFSQIPLVCPLPAGVYEIYNMVLPPKNFPLPMSYTDCEMSISFVITATKEVMLSTNTSLRTERRKYKTTKSK